MENTVYDRTEILFGKSNMEKIKSAKICIIGIGGVGSYVLEALARTGIQNITVIDKDKVDITNINRQLIATRDNIGKEKVLCAKERVESINNKIAVEAICDKISTENIGKYINETYTYVIDAVDDVDAKIAVIKKCKEVGIKVLSAMGMANRIDPVKIKIADIEKTFICPLAKVVRKRLKEENIKKVKVVFSEEEPLKTDSKTLGSISYVTGTAGFVIASEVIKDIIKY